MSLLGRQEALCQRLQQDTAARSVHCWESVWYSRVTNLRGQTGAAASISASQYTACTLLHCTVSFILKKCNFLHQTKHFLGGSFLTFLNGQLLSSVVFGYKFWSVFEERSDIFYRSPGIRTKLDILNTVKCKFLNMQKKVNWHIRRTKTVEVSWCMWKLKA